MPEICVCFENSQNHSENSDNFYIFKITNYSPYKAKWQIPKLILKACTINFDAPNYIYIFQLFLAFFESYMEYKEY